MTHLEIEENLAQYLQGYPRLWKFIERVIKAKYLVREGRFLAHLREYLRHKILQYRARRDASLSYNDMLAKIDPDGAFMFAKKDRKAPEASELYFPATENPSISVIIPCYGQVDYTLRCLDSLYKRMPETAIEIIVIEDASGDPRSAELRKVKGITYIERSQNMGFLRSCNDAVKMARGHYILLLNNDTYVMPGAIDSLASLLRKRPDAGMVGARLVYPDGILQEAGGIVWNDGTAWNYGRKDNPFKPEYNYVREADYLSGAAIMLARSLWDKLGGFDELYLPAYCEDSDLAFRVRREGLKVLYQPEAWVIHDEGISHGTDINGGIKAYQVENNKKLKERWGDVFRREHFESGTRIMRARDRAANRKITLVVDHYVPEPDRDAGSRTMMFFMDALLEAGRIVKFWPDNGIATPRYVQALQRRGIEVLCGSTTRGFNHWIAENGAEIDEVILSRPTVAPAYLELLRKHTRAPILFYGHDLHFARMELEAGILKDPAIKAAAAGMRMKEISVWKNVDIALYPSEEEVEIIQNIAPDVLVRGISPYAFARVEPRTTLPSGGADILFVAGFAHTPNVDAAQWFCAEILPLIRAKKPEIRVAFVGSNPTNAVKAMACDTVAVTGFVSDEELARFYATARVAVAPLRFGAGIKLKVVEGMHAGVPMVTTPVGAQGLREIDGSLDICADPVSFANAVLHLLDDDDWWFERSARQVDYVNRIFSKESLARDLDNAFVLAAAKGKGRRL